MSALSAICFAVAASAQVTKDPGDLPEFFAGDWTVKGRETTFWLRGDTRIFVSHFDEGTEIVRTQLKITPTKTGNLLLEETSRNGAGWTVTSRKSIFVSTRRRSERAEQIIRAGALRGVA